MCRQEQNKQRKIKVSGQWFMHARIGLRTHNQARKQDYAYASPYPKDLKTQKQIRNKNSNSNSQTCSEYTRRHKPTLNKQVITQTKQEKIN